jgi:hypothetical protein
VIEDAEMAEMARTLGPHSSGMRHYGLRRPNAFINTNGFPKGPPSEATLRRDLTDQIVALCDREPSAILRALGPEGTCSGAFDKEVDGGAPESSAPAHLRQNRLMDPRAGGAIPPGTRLERRLGYANPSDTRMVARRLRGSRRALSHLSTERGLPDGWQSIISTEDDD